MATCSPFTMVSKFRRKAGDEEGNPTYIFTEPRVGFRKPEGKEPSTPLTAT